MPFNKKMDGYQNEKEFICALNKKSLNVLISHYKNFCVFYMGKLTVMRLYMLNLVMESRRQI